MPAHLRPHKWAFVGQPKKFDRAEMIKTFSELHALPKMDKDLPNPRAMRALYESATFVPIGRGWVSTECFRIYEAASAGAIPVIVLNSAHRNYSHGFVARLESEEPLVPPFVFANSWPEAYAEVSRLLLDAKELLAQQTRVMQWWDAAWERTVEMLYS